MRASITRIKTFKACRKAYEFKYLEDLIPVKPAESLEIGKRYHKYLEMMEKGEDFIFDYSKESAMAHAYKKYILPQLHVIAAEKELEKQIGDHVLHGFVDGLTDDGYIVEHKTTSRDIKEGGEYEYNLLWDEQVLAYMSLTGMRKVYYTVCKKPTIRIKKDESEEDFWNRMCAWYDENTEEKIRLFIVERTDAEVAQFEQDFEQICDEMEKGAIYRNTCHCNAYNRRCEYSSICLNYDPGQQYIDFVKSERKVGNENELVYGEF